MASRTRGETPLVTRPITNRPGRGRSVHGQMTDPVLLQPKLTAPSSWWDPGAARIPNTPLPDRWSADTHTAQNAYAPRRSSSPLPAAAHSLRRCGRCQAGRRPRHRAPGAPANRRRAALPRRRGDGAGPWGWEGPAAGPAPRPRPSRRGHGRAAGGRGWGVCTRGPRGACVHLTICFLRVAPQYTRSS